MRSIYIFEADNMNDIMENVVKTVIREGKVVSPRGMKTYELAPAVIILHDITKNVVTKGLVTDLNYARAELQFYLKGTNKIKDIHPYEHIWLPYSDDGETVNSAYGYMIFGNHPDVRVNQWEWVKEKLRNDPDSRQAIININLPAHKERPTKDFPCTVFLQYLIRDGKLHAYTYMRSNDIYRGFRYDIYAFSELQKMLADDLGLDYGTYYHFATSLHLYESDLNEIRKIYNLEVVNERKTAVDF